MLLEIAEIYMGIGIASPTLEFKCKLSIWSAFYMGI